MQFDRVSSERHTTTNTNTNANANGKTSTTTTKIGGVPPPLQRPRLRKPVLIHREPISSHILKSSQLHRSKLQRQNNSKNETHNQSGYDEDEHDGSEGSLYDHVEQKETTLDNHSPTISHSNGDASLLSFNESKNHDNLRSNLGAVKRNVRINVGKPLPLEYPSSSSNSKSQSMSTLVNDSHNPGKEQQRSQHDGRIPTRGRSLSRSGSRPSRVGQHDFQASVSDGIPTALDDNDDVRVNSQQNRKAQFQQQQQKQQQQIRQIESHKKDQWMRKLKPSVEHERLRKFASLNSKNPDETDVKYENIGTTFNDYILQGSSSGVHDYNNKLFNVSEMRRLKRQNILKKNVLELRRLSAEAHLNSSIEQQQSKDIDPNHSIHHESKLELDKEIEEKRKQILELDRKLEELKAEERSFSSRSNTEEDGSTIDVSNPKDNTELSENHEYAAADIHNDILSDIIDGDQNYANEREKQLEESNHLQRKEQVPQMNNVKLNSFGLAHSSFGEDLKESHKDSIQSLSFTSGKDNSIVKNDNQNIEPLLQDNRQNTQVVNHVEEENPPTIDNDNGHNTTADATVVEEVSISKNAKKSSMNSILAFLLKLLSILVVLVIIIVILSYVVSD
ncbi:unnamed protein product [Ambrosiozyma monospora]|uniref:Unnamed protein product n=1 Tax=Ambrosiozyma monospora TaxID=43982 RepID=A0A9W7DG71_AMBMO|nr:unnamed protein product [Ambrosiozyma monospora]